MTKSALMIIFVSFGLLMCTNLFNACGKFGTQGTVIGNPFSQDPSNSPTITLPSASTNPSLSPPQTFTLQFVGALATKLSQCNAGLTTEVAQAGLLNEMGFGPNLGLPSTSQSNSQYTLQEIVNLETVQLIAPSATSAQSCIDSIQNISCADSTVAGGYAVSSGAADPFSAASAIPTGIPACGSFF